MRRSGPPGQGDCAREGRASSAGAASSKAAGHGHDALPSMIGTATIAGLPRCSDAPADPDSEGTRGRLAANAALRPICGAAGADVCPRRGLPAPETLGRRQRPWRPCSASRTCMGWRWAGPRGDGGEAASPGARGPCRDGGHGGCAPKARRPCRLGRKAGRAGARTTRPMTRGARGMKGCAPCWTSPSTPPPPSSRASMRAGKGRAPSRQPCFPGQALHHHDPAAQCHGQPAYRHALEQHVAGRADPLAAHAGRYALWQPGTDHAGIATQMVVERLLAQRAMPTADHGARGLRRAGVAVESRNPAARSRGSCAGSAPRSTGRASASPWMRGCPARCARCSCGCNREGLLYRDRRLVNWTRNSSPPFPTWKWRAGRVKVSLWHLR